jgi:hypothetical protein
MTQYVTTVRAEPVEAHFSFDKLRTNEIDLSPIAPESIAPAGILPETCTGPTGSRLRRHPEQA